jgi:hypothetical protein
MIILGFLLVLLGHWFFPAYVPEVPPRLDNLCEGVGILFLIIGIILLVIGFLGHSVGGRRWYF